MSKLDEPLCPGCGDVWRSFDSVTCDECGFEAEEVATVREMMLENQHQDLCDLAAFARGVARVVLENAAEVRDLLGMRQP